MKTVYCIGFVECGECVADWYTRQDVRDENKGSTGAGKEVYFDFSVPEGARQDQITAMVDDMSWFHFTFLIKKEPSQLDAAV